MNKPHISISQITMLARCPKQWEFRYVDGIKSPPGVAAMIGKGTHAAIEADLGQKMSWGTLLDTSDVRDAARDGLNAAWQAEPPVIRDGDMDQGQASDLAVSLASLYHVEAAPTIEPIALEQSFLIEIPQLPHDIMGVVDVEEATKVRDTKTIGKSPQSSVAERSAQLHGYHLRATLDGHPEKTVVLDHLVKMKVPKYVSVEAAPGRAEHIAFLRRAELASKMITAGIFPPTNPDNWWCSKKWCGYWDRCEFGASKSTTVGLIDPSSLTSRLIQNPHRADTTEYDTDGA